MSRTTETKKMCENLHNDGYPISYEELTARYPDTILTRAHFARFLCEKGAVSSIDSAFRKILSDKGPYFVSRKYLTPEEGIELIKKSRWHTGSGTPPCCTNFQSQSFMIFLTF